MYSIGVILDSYPFGVREAYFHEELKYLSQRFDRVYIIIPDADALDKSKSYFSLPENTEVLFIENSNRKALNFFNLFKLNLVRILNNGIKNLRIHKLPVSLSTLKVILAYDLKERPFRLCLEKKLLEKNINLNNFAIYSYWFSDYTFATSKLKNKYPGLKAYSRMHRWDIYFEFHNPPYLPYRKQIIDKLDGLFMVSYHGKDYLKTKFRIDSPKIQVQRLGVSGIERNKCIPEKNRIRLLSNAYVSPVKNLESLIGALSKIDDIEITWTHIGGGDEYYEKIIQLATEMLAGRNNIKFHFTGNIDPSEVLNFLGNNEVDVLVNTSFSEGIPVSIMEAMSFGIPVIATDVGGVEEIVKHKHNGYLINSNNVEIELVDALRKLNELSTAERLKLKENAFNTWKVDFNAQINYTKLANFIYQRLNER